MESEKPVILATRSASSANACYNPKEESEETGKTYKHGGGNSHNCYNKSHQPRDCMLEVSRRTAH